MAALLRELSSLDSDNDAETSRHGVAGMSPVAPPVASRPRP